MRPTAILRALDTVRFFKDEIHRKNPRLRQMAIDQAKRLYEKEKAVFEALNINTAIILGGLHNDLRNPDKRGLHWTVVYQDAAGLIRKTKHVYPEDEGPYDGANVGVEVAKDTDLPAHVAATDKKKKKS
ncbi:hypothetical protein E4U31_003978 [Claviceps sp. LM219 group G6]|nr:hypothetical protein E4U31_003978 [Claviceps sp. LM219 group G6]